MQLSESLKPPRLLLNPFLDFLGMRPYRSFSEWIPEDGLKQKAALNHTFQYGGARTLNGGAGTRFIYIPKGEFAGTR